MFVLQIEKENVKRINLKEKDSFYFYNAGEIFEPDIDIKEIYKRIKSENIKDFLGEFSYLFEDKENVYIINDELGSIKWFYFYDENSFLVSNNLWYLVKEKGLTTKDLDVLALYETLVMYFPLNNKTFFKRIKVVPKGSILVYSKKKRKFSIKTYKPIEYRISKKYNSKEELFNKIDKAFEKTTDKIFSKNNDPFIAVTISGGLDSRFPLFYLERFSKKIAYLIGINKKFLDALDFKSAKKIAKYFGLRLKLINPFSIDFYKKAMIDISRNPIGPSNILKAIDKKRYFDENEKFNILITGAYGGMIGGRILNDELLSSKERKELINKLFLFYSSISDLEQLETGKAQSIFIKKSLYKILSFFGLSKIRANLHEKLDNFKKSNFLIPSEIRVKIIKEYEKFFENIAGNNLTLIMNLHLSRHTIRGAFESLHGQVKSYSIYYPYIYELSKEWDKNFLKKRKIMEEFLLWKDKNIASIPLQTFELPLTFKNKPINKYYNFLYKIISLLNFIIRGLVINYNDWWKNKKVKTFVKKIQNYECKTFDEFFDSEDVKKVFNYGRYNLLVEQLLKIKLILIIIENQEYDKLLDIHIEESEKY
ncbi:hypothetical protein [Nitrosophilus labii]|uniref:hypothetical protein n=1 Tax=Nitrosophilus labii TaxID=2706014 RepID=UPI0016572CB7|nr:hypothetical protein [Nitrosophilus labii]